jgi:uncharacterized protein (DUF2249 family)
MTRGVGIAKRGFGKALSRTGYSAGGEVMEDMSSIHEEAESPKEEAKETKLEKKGYKETKTGKMIKDPKFRKAAGTGQPYMGPSKKEFELKEDRRRAPVITEEIKEIRERAPIIEDRDPEEFEYNLKMKKGGKVKMHKMPGGKMMKNSDMKKGKK